MKINVKNLLLTMLIALLPMVLGIVLLPKLPDSVAIHWGMNNEPNGWVNKYFAVFGLPSFMAFMQFIISITIDLQVKGKKPKLIKIALWIIPIISIVLFTMTMYLALGNELEVHLISGLILGTVSIIFGNYLPKVPQEKNGELFAKNLSPEKYKKAMRRMGIFMLIFGISILTSLFINELVFGVIIGVGIVAISVLSVVSLLRK
jgi:uncharacterized membrane protein